MRITLQTVSEFRHYFGSGAVEVEFTRSTVSEFLEQLREQYRFDVFPDDYTMLFINGKGCADFSQRLADGDRVAIIPILAAG